MIDGRKTARELAQEGYWNDIKDQVKIIVRNDGENELTGHSVAIQTSFSTIEEALHKVKLDIITNAKHNLKEPIKVFVRRIIKE